MNMMYNIMWNVMYWVSMVDIYSYYITLLVFHHSHLHSHHLLTLTTGEQLQLFAGNQHSARVYRCRSFCCHPLSSFEHADWLEYWPHTCIYINWNYRHTRLLCYSQTPILMCTYEEPPLRVQLGCSTRMVVYLLNNNNTIYKYSSIKFWQEFCTVEEHSHIFIDFATHKSQIMIRTSDNGGSHHTSILKNCSHL